MDSAAPAQRQAAALELAAETARKFGKLKIKVTGDSMLPAVWPGDVLTVLRQPLARFRPGDIVLAARRAAGNSRSELEFVAHRVLRRQGDHLLTRGDSLSHHDPPLSEPEILGRVVSVTREGRPIDPSLTPGRRLTAWILRRSAFSVRVLRRLNRF